MCWVCDGGGANVWCEQESDKSLYKPTLDSIKESIKTSTSSMTAVPKPLKFLRPHYAKLEEAYQSWPKGDDKVGMHNSWYEIAKLIMDIDITRRHALGPRHDLLGRRAKRHTQVPPACAIDRLRLVGPRIHATSRARDR